MSAKPKLQPNWSLLMPAILLLVECIALIALNLMGYRIPQNLLYIFIALGIFWFIRSGNNSQPSCVSKALSGS